MSTASGTATSYLNLLSLLRTFLTTDSTLVGLGQNWTEVHTVSTPYTDSHGDTVEYETYLQAPGLSGTETIFLNIQAYQNTVLDYYNWRMAGAVGYNSGSTFNNQPGQSPFEFSLMWNQPIPYWFFANGQRVIIIAKISTVYEPIYLGKFLPYATPGQYPYPVLVGGSSFTFNMRFSDTTDNHRAFFNPCSDQIYFVDGSWREFANKSAGGINQNQLGPAWQNVWPWFYDITSGLALTWAASDEDTGYPLMPAILSMGNPSNLAAIPYNILGELDGVFFIPGYSQASENTITVGSDTYQVFQNVFRTSAGEYMAVKVA